jgi:hypothetical protein
MPTQEELIIETIQACPIGVPGWRAFEDAGITALSHLFVPPLAEPTIQPRSFSGIDRRDAVYPNRNLTAETFWGQLHIELKARLVLVEFKNYDIQELSKDEVDQTRNYLTKPFGKLALICCRREPSKAALLRRNQVYTQEDKVILFITEETLCEMLRMKERGEDPARLIVELVELFYMQHE